MTENTNGPASNHSSVIAREAQRLAEVLAACPPDAPVPSCPGWTAKDLLWHLTTVHRFWATILPENPSAEQVEVIESEAPAEPATVEEMLPVREQWTDALCQQLDAHCDDTERWSWYAADQTVGFTRRMQLAEATLHRLDAELTAGQPVTPLAPEVARAVIDHAMKVMYDLDAMLPWLADGGSLGTDGVVALEAIDTDDRWGARVRHYRWSTTAGEPRAAWGLTPAPITEAVATVRGTLPELALWLWTRPGQVETSGDSSTLDALRALHEAGIQ